MSRLTQGQGGIAGHNVPRPLLLQYLRPGILEDGDLVHLATCFGPKLYLQQIVRSRSEFLCVSTYNLPADRLTHDRIYVRHGKHGRFLNNRVSNVDGLPGTSRDGTRDRSARSNMLRRITGESS